MNREDFERKMAEDKSRFDTGLNELEDSIDRVIRKAYDRGFAVGAVAGAMVGAALMAIVLT